LRNGYRTAPLPMRMVGIRTLLCDNCNFEFRAFCPREPKRGNGQRSKRKADVFNAAPAVDLQTVGQPGAAAARRSPAAISFDRSALPVHPANQAAANQVATSDIRSALPDLPEDFDDELKLQPATSAAEEALPGNMRSRISSPPSPVATEEPLIKLKEDLEERRKKGSSQVCPQCQSHDVSRRHRRLWQRLVFGLTQIRPYRCDNCGHTFYASRLPHRRRDSLTQSEAELVKNSCFNQTESGQPESR
jgi:hypothetical protein